MNEIGTGPDRLNSELLKKKGVYFFQAVDSTNLTARSLAEKGAPGFTTVIAEEQKKGRGRLGRTWFSPPYGGLLFSIVLRPGKISPSETAPVTLVTAAVLAEHFIENLALPAAVKWPNDLLLGGKKAGGILTETKGDSKHIEYLVVGIGLNINQRQNDFPPELSRLATSLAVESGRHFDRTTLFISLREKLVNAYIMFFEKGFTPFCRLWKKHNITLGRVVTVSRPEGQIVGTAFDLSAEGALLIKDSRGQIKTITHGEITLT